jgi:hypothetical protein
MMLIGIPRLKPGVIVWLIKYPSCRLRIGGAADFANAEYGGVVFFWINMIICLEKSTTPVIAKPLDLPLLFASEQEGYFRKKSISKRT